MGKLNGRWSRVGLSKVIPRAFTDVIGHLEDTMIEGIPHFPSHTARLQLGIWDASSQAGTAKWAKGPIDWSQTPSQVTAVIRSVTVECPHS